MIRTSHNALDNNIHYIMHTSWIHYLTFLPLHIMSNDVFASMWHTHTIWPHTTSIVHTSLCMPQRHSIYNDLHIGTACPSLSCNELVKSQRNIWLTTMLLHSMKRWMVWCCKKVLMTEYSVFVQRSANTTQHYAMWQHVMKFVENSSTKCMWNRACCSWCFIYKSNMWAMHARCDRSWFFFTAICVYAPICTYMILSDMSWNAVHMLVTQPQEPRLVYVECQMCRCVPFFRV